MNTDWQTWTALAIVALAAGLLFRSWWRRRGHEHEGCDCPGTRANRAWTKVKKQAARQR